LRRKQKQTESLPKIRFTIDHLDPMGQGVDKSGKKVTFIGGVLPGETGMARVFKRVKGVQFAVVESLDQVSSQRVKAQCPHFEQCPGCQYQHVSYEDELSFKKEALSRHLSGLKFVDLKVVPAPRRFAYRNRVQLHYRRKYIGLLDGTQDKVVEVPNCLLIKKEMQDKFDTLYQQKDWQDVHLGRGHCELYMKDEEVNLIWNESYAQGGFTQVFDEMNERLQKQIASYVEGKNIRSLLDLFSGSGNLSNNLGIEQTVLVDSFQSDRFQTDSGQSEEAGQKEFYGLDLYEEESLTRFVRKYKKIQFDAVVIDPPRRGFPLIDSWVRRIKPKHLFYVSCNPASLARDLKSLKKPYKIEEVHLLDLFPATSHFETLVSLKFK